jgi:hypothetical protein
MLHHIKKLFGIKPKAEEAKVEVPYKVEAAPVETFPVPKEARTPKAKKPTVKKATTRKPRTPKAPK